MSRWVGFTDDPTAGGTTYDELVAAESTKRIKKPTLWVPATSAQVTPNPSELSRKDEVRGRRGDVPPISFASTPGMTIEGRGYPEILNKLLLACLGGAVTKSGVAPAAITSKWEPTQSNPLPALIMWLLREEQLDRLTGAIVAELDINFPIDGESTWTAAFEGLYHDAQDPTSPKDPKPGGGEQAAEAFGTPDYHLEDYTFMLRDAIAKRGSSETEIPNLAGFRFGFNNGMITDPTSRFKPGHNIQKTTIDGVLHKLWLPARHKIGPQVVTGTIDLSAVDATEEAKYILSHAEKLIFEVAGGPAGTTPEADEMLRIIIAQQSLTGGGAEPLKREGDQRSSYTFTGYIDSTTSKDVIVEAVAAAEVK